MDTLCRQMSRMSLIPDSYPGAPIARLCYIPTLDSRKTIPCGLHLQPRRSDVAILRTHLTRVARYSINLRFVP